MTPPSWGGRSKNPRATGTRQQLDGRSWLLLDQAARSFEVDADLASEEEGRDGERKPSLGLEGYVR